MTKPLKLCVVDSDDWDRGLFKALMQGSARDDIATHRPWLRDVQVEYLVRHLRDPELYTEFDGCVLAANSGGLEMGRNIHKASPRLPLLLTTQSENERPPPDVYDYFWYVLTKPTKGATRRSTDDVLGLMRAFVRTCAAVRDGR